MRFLLLLIALVAPLVSGAQAENVPKVESRDCIYKADGAHKTTWLSDRTRESSQPTRHGYQAAFYIVESNNPAKKPDPVLYTWGGPGFSSLHPVTSTAMSRAAEQAEIVRWIEVPNSVLLLLLVPGDPESGGVYAK